jgi:hypothetical protein
MDKANEITLDQLYVEITDLKDDLNFNLGMIATFIGDLEGSKRYQELARKRFSELETLWEKQAEILERVGA